MLAMLLYPAGYPGSCQQPDSVTAADPIESRPRNGNLTIPYVHCVVTVVIVCAHAGELMSVRKPMRPWSGQELTSNRLPLPLPDPYGNEPPRPDPTHLTIRTDCPYTAEPNNEQLLQAGLVTPNHLFYIRDHLPAPILSAESYSLTIEGPGVRSEILLQQKQGCRDDVGSSTSSARSSKSTATAVDILHTPSASSTTTTSSSSSGTKPGKLVLTLQDSQERFPQHSILVTLQCAGNRRNDMRRHKEVKGGPWEAGAIGTALWTGPRLREVLSAAGVDVEGLLVAERRRQQQQQAQWAEGAARHLIQRQQQGGPQEGVTAFTSQAATAAAAAADLAAEAGAGAAAAGLESAAAAAAAARIQGAPSATGTAAPHTPEAPAEPHLLAPAAAAAADSADAVPDVRHVWFEGYDSAGPDTHFLVSVPVLDALAEDADVLLALQVSGVSSFLHWAVFKVFKKEDSQSEGVGGSKAVGSTVNCKSSPGVKCGRLSRGCWA